MEKGIVVENSRGLATLCDRLRGAAAVAVDTEFVSEGRYYPDLATIQVAAPGVLALIDCQAVTDLSPTAELLGSTSVIKVFHAGKQDLEILFRAIGGPVRNIFDTQVAAAFLGFGEQVSLKNLAKSVLDIDLKKGNSYTDWLRRPLTREQIQYALDDVRHLLAIFDALVVRLTQTGRRTWVEEELAYMSDPRHFADTPDETAYLGVKGASRLSGRALGILQKLAAWREGAARQLNVPAQRMVGDHVLVQLAIQPPKNLAELAATRGLHPRQMREFGEHIVQAVREGMTNTVPRMEYPESFPDELEATVDFLMICIRTVTREQSISKGVVATRDDLRSLVRRGEDADIPLVRGWRRALVGDTLLAALAGKTAARVDKATKLVTLS